MVKAALVDKNGLRKGAWSKEEDDKLRVYILKYGHWNWRQLPKFAGLARCGKSCRLRWMNYLRPDVKRGNFSEEEDSLIIQMHEELGNKWSIMAGKLPGRTDNEIKNHWHTNLSKRSKQNQSILPELMTKEQSTETSKSEVCQPEKSETGSVSVNSLFEPDDQDPKMEISCSEISSSMSSDSLSAMNGVAEDSLSSMEIFQDFWNLPFVEDFWYLPYLEDNNNYNQEGFGSLFSTEEGLMSPPYPPIYGDDDGSDWIHQVMQQLEDRI